MKKSKRERYNQDWEMTSLRIRTVRAQNRCEQCGIHNLAIIKRFKEGIYRQATVDELRQLFEIRASFGVKEMTAIRMMKLTKVIITVAHLDHNEKNDDESNLRALCQRCHILHDKVDNRIRSRHKKNAIIATHYMTLPFPVENHSIL